MIREISKYIEKLLEKKDKINILSAGSGIDYIACSLERRFKDKVSICLFDISSICIDRNKALFGTNLEYKVGNIFDYNFLEKFDIVYNTGLLEHFSEKEQTKIINQIRRILNTDGYYITLNPSDTGFVYKKGMKIAKEKGTWKFGNEFPIKSLSKFSREDFKLVSEKNCCSFSQLSFLKYYSPLYYLAFPFLFLNCLTGSGLSDILFGRFLGYYGLLSVFRKV